MGKARWRLSRATVAARPEYARATAQNISTHSMYGCRSERIAHHLKCCATNPELTSLDLERCMRGARVRRWPTEHDVTKSIEVSSGFDLTDSEVI
jgi:hypothetical protein